MSPSSKGIDTVEIAHVSVYPFAENARSPEVYIDVDGLQPEQSLFRHRGCDGHDGDRHFMGTYGGLVRYCVEGELDHSNVDVSPITLLDGSEYLTEKRWWSSRPGSVNLCFPDTPIVGVVACFRTDRGHRSGWISGLALPLATAQALVAEHCPGWELALSEDPWLTGDCVYEPRLKGSRFKRGRFKWENPGPYRAMTHTIGQLRNDFGWS